MGSFDSKIQVGMSFGTVGSMKQNIEDYAKKNNYVASSRFQGPMNEPIRIHTTGIYYTNSSDCMSTPSMSCIFNSDNRKITQAVASFEGLLYDTTGNIPDYDNENNIKFTKITDGKYVAIDRDGDGYVGSDEIEEIKQE